MKRPVRSYLAVLLAVGLLDLLWLGFIATEWYQAGMAHLLAPRPNFWAAAAFYLLYPIGLLLFAVGPARGRWRHALVLGALFGLFAYGTYDLTNLAVLRDWPLVLSAVDMAWGAFVSAAGATAGALALRGSGLAP